jgi:hypothetical protein
MLLRDLDPASTASTNCSWFGIQKGIGLASDQILVDGADVVGELEFDFFVAKLFFEEYFRQVGVGHVLVPAQVAEREIPASTEPAARSQGPSYQQ